MIKWLLMKPASRMRAMKDRLVTIVIVVAFLVGMLLVDSWIKARSSESADLQASICLKSA